MSNAVSPAGTMIINNDDRYTFTSGVSLDLNVNNAAEMRFRNEGGSWSDVESFAPTKEWVIGPGPGVKTVYGHFLGEGGRSTILMDTIIPLIEQKISASNGSIGDYFGGLPEASNGAPVSISRDGTVIVVGVPYDTVNGNPTQGSAYVYRWNGSAWDESWLTASDGGSSNRFGFSTGVSADGSIIVAGAYLANAAYVYRWSGEEWLETKIIPAFYDGEFGVSVDIAANGGTILVGAHKPLAPNVPYVSVCSWNGTSWEQTMVTASDNAPVGYGISVSCSGDGSAFVVGSRYDNGTVGAAYIYRRNGNLWDETKIIASDGGGLFGKSVAMSDDGGMVIVGSHMKNVGPDTARGAAYAYRYGGGAWHEYAITASDGMANDQFGYSVDIASDGESVIIGAHLDDGETNSNSGSAYLYRWNGTGWSEIVKLHNAAGANGDRFGYCARISGDGSTLAVSAPGDSSNRGAVFVY